MSGEGTATPARSIISQYADFRGSFPEFADTTKYTDRMIAFWYGVADKLLNVIRWDDLLAEGQMLFVAHQITLQARHVADVAVGGDPGRSSALISNQSVGGVSVGYDNAASLEEGAGHWNETQYGRQFWALMQIVGSGGYFVGVGAYIE